MALRPTSQRIRAFILPVVLTASLTDGSIVVWPCIVAAQGGVTGRVVDSAGRPLSGASVAMMPASGGIATTTRTGSDGTYRLADLTDGFYRIDFELARFDVTRRNNVQVRNGATVFGDAALQESWTCHCSVVVVGMPPVAERSGRVRDFAGRPLPHARLEIVISILDDPAVGPAAGWREWRSIDYADAEGRFSVLVPLNSHAPLIASDSGFAPVKQMVSGADAGEIVFRLPYLESPRAGELENYERFPRSCRCPTNLFTHPS